MRKTITFLSTLLLLAAKPAFSQIKFGIRGGFNLATMAGQGLTGYNVSMRTAMHIGVIAEKSISAHTGIESGLLLSGKGAKIAGVTTAPLYLEIPLNVVYRERFGSSQLHLAAGPYFGLGIAGKITFDNSAATDIKFGNADDSHYSLTDLGLNIGAGIEIRRFMIRLQYGLSLLNLDPKDRADEDTKHRVIGISMGYMLGY